MHQPTTESILLHQSFVLALARSLVRDEASAEDLAQETWVAALSQPPQPGPVRAWLARVVRHGAINSWRAEQRRGERERLGARDEAQDESLARERLELQHEVVSAVLALDEPYRSVVIAVYSRGKTPKEIALERGIAPGTVRAQLSRALARLRARLDRDRGSRAAWAVPLAAWRGESTAPTASAPPAVASTGPLAAALAGAALVGVTAVAGWLALSDERGGSQSRIALAPTAPSQTSALLAQASEQAETASREPLAGPATAAPAAVEPNSPARAADELSEMLVRLRQIKQLLLARALEPETDTVRELAWLLDLPETGVARMVSRERFGFDLPWLHGGGAFWSFLNKTHDYQSAPQIGLSKGTREIASGFYGNADGIVVDLGSGQPQDLLARDPQAIEAALDPVRRQAWEILWRDVEVTPEFDPHTLVSELRKLRLDDDADVETGHTYLVRAISPDEYDVVAGLHVARSGEDGVTFGWRLFESRPVARRRAPRALRETADSLPEPLPELAALGESELTSELASLRERGTQMLFEAMPPEVASRATALAGRADAGVVRILDGDGPWTEFPAVRSGGQFYSFATRSHDYDEHPDLNLHSGSYRSGFYGGTLGWIADIGDIAVDAVTRVTTGDMEPAAWRFLLDKEIFVADGPGIAELLEEAGRLAKEAGLQSAAKALVGHTYLVRSSLSQHHDHLVAFRPLSADERGQFIEWRVLKSWPVYDSGR